MENSKAFNFWKHDFPEWKPSAEHRVNSDFWEQEYAEWTVEGLSEWVVEGLDEWEIIDWKMLEKKIL